MSRFFTNRMNGVGMRIFCLLCCFATFVFSEEIEELKFVQLIEEEKSTKLQTAITTYENNGVQVDLVGAIHIGDKEYYKNLNKVFKTYDLVLFELIGGEHYGQGKGIPKQRNKAKDDDPGLGLLKDAFIGMSEQMKLSLQVEEVDYGRKNFLHADLTRKQFLDLQKDRGENLMTFALAEGAALEEAGQMNQLMTVLGAMLANNPEYLKLQYARLLAKSKTGSHGLIGQSVILDERNEVAMDLLKKELKNDHKKIAIFYGAAHLHGMHEILLSEDYKLKDHRWITAWEIEKKR